jgi:hypothetical protein
MKFVKLAAPLIVCLLVFNLAHGKPKKPDLPAVFQNAKYIYVEAVDGDILKPGLFPEDRQAISDVEDSLRTWKRYAIALNRNDADLVIVVRKGRLAAGQVHGGISGGSRPATGPGASPLPGQTRGPEVGVRTDVGEPDDMLRVYIQNEGELKAIVWDRTLEGGLDAPSVQLVRQLRAAVEKAYPQQPAPNKP